MNTCRTCKWWQRDAVPGGYMLMSGEFVFPMPFDEVDPDPPRRAEYRPCGLTAYGSYEYDHPESLALATDAESYEAELYTAPDFGCVQWSACSHPCAHSDDS